MKTQSFILNWPPFDNARPTFHHMSIGARASIFRCKASIKVIKTMVLNYTRITIYT